MVDNNVYGDLIARCGGKVSIALTPVECEENILSNLATVFADNNLQAGEFGEASFEIIITRSDGNAQEQAINRCNQAGKPTVIALFNSEEAAISMRQKYGVAVVAIGGEINSETVNNLLRAALFEFPVKCIDINIPEWMRYMPCDCSAIENLLENVRALSREINKMSDVSRFDNAFSDNKFWQATPSVNMDVGAGKITVNLAAKEGIYYEMLSEIAGDEIGDECTLMRYVGSASDAKRSYDKIKGAFECAKVNGYGIVEPDDSDMQFDKPEAVRQGGSVGIKLKATAPCYHIVKVDVTGEVSPIMGSAKQSEGIVAGMMNGFETNPDGMWETNVFGKSLRGMVKEGLSGKVCGMNDETKSKMRRAISRIVNDGKGGVICILL